MTGAYCAVVPLAVDHAADLHVAAADDRDGRTWTYLPYGPFGSEREYREWMEATCFGDDPLFHAILEGPGGPARGVAAYLNIRPHQGSIEVGHVYFPPALQRTRAATEAMYLMMKRAFDLGYRRYEWKCDALNGPSRAAAERLGCSFEGIFRQATVYKGRNRDTAWYSAIDREWPALAAAFESWLHPSNFDANGGQRAGLSELTRHALRAT